MVRAIGNTFVNQKSCTLNDLNDVKITVNYCPTGATVIYFLQYLTVYFNTVVFNKATVYLQRAIQLAILANILFYLRQDKLITQLFKLNTCPKVNKDICITYQKFTACLDELKYNHRIS